jgi:hypothetical protein
MAFVGWGQKSLAIGELCEHPCIVCGQPRDYSVSRIYSYIHLYKVFGLTLRQHYSAECTRCGHILTISRSHFPDMRANVQVPFMQRWGLLVFLAALIVTIGLIVAVTVKFADHATAQAVASAIHAESQS